MDALPVKSVLVDQQLNYWKVVKIFLSRWYWILGCVIISTLVAWLYIRTIPPTYTTNASLKLDDSQSDMTGNGVANMRSYNRYYQSNNIQTEATVMRSQDVINKAITHLNYKISYFLKGRVLTTELYPNEPFKIEIIAQDSVNFSRATYNVEPIDNTNFQLISSDQPNQKQIFKYGQAISAGNMLFSIRSRIPAKGNYSFKFNTKSDFYGRAAGGLNIFEAEKYSNIMNVTHTDFNPVFSADILNAIIKEYILNDAEQKKRSSKQTIAYLDSQIEFLNRQVDQSGKNLSNYRSGSTMVDPLTDKQFNIGKLSTLQTQRTELEFQKFSIQQLEEQVKGNQEKIRLNLDIDGVASLGLPALITQLGTFISARETKLNQFNADAAPIKQIDDQIAEIKQLIYGNIRSLKNRNQKTIDLINNEINKVNGSLGQLPEKENDFAKLQSNFDINQKMFSLLFEKKLAAQISSAAVTPGANIINEAQPSFNPVSPVASQIYSSYMIGGLLVGLGMIVLARLLNPYIYDVETVEGLTAIPIIGVILKFKRKIYNETQQMLSLEKPKSIFAESVRSVRTNLSFLASDKDNKVICVTSEISGEGKSFVSLNLAGTLSIIDKKVILIAADLRRSKLHKAFGSENLKGLSTYLSAQSDLDGIINQDENHHFDYITSGPVPPNPSELLHSSRMKALIEALRERYEYVIIDTAPIGLVSDSIPIIKQADINLFIIRSGVSKFSAASVPERLSKEYALNNISIILNSFSNELLHSNIHTSNYTQSGSGTYYYSNYSGYGSSAYYEQEEEKWWQFWKKK
ncbi:polysaccharide biosynthesis tyrosine autokinase [Pedobacter frigidisoli]|uniref:Polysaccharide biosynthesis tyrosine autokinase n=1 Tax=Pedobacter frigidisoli TaxID=2530455 RepID=A0A4R0NS41_9SPHI|nr:tyrosine-protein kinase family protein [Pedobacter frigidisoli]TCD02195.1 polysaccharide biosynthesis tyrosine autokinase [Pedobacter frigidisoli]